MVLLQNDSGGLRRVVPLASVEMTLVLALTCYLLPFHRNADLSESMMYRIQLPSLILKFRIIFCQSIFTLLIAKIPPRLGLMILSFGHSFALEVYISLNR